MVSITVSSVVPMMPILTSKHSNSAPIEELSVRANLALNQKKLVVANSASRGFDVSELEDEYKGLCAQVDKVTLKLFMATVEAGKLERALDLVERLHLEKSFDIAITVAERMNYRTLGDKVEHVKHRRFAVEEEDDDDFGQTEELFPDSQVEPITEVHTPHRPSRNISPESQIISRTKRRHEELQPGSVPERRPIANPFAKKRIESPARPSLSPTKQSPARVGISRLSSFSAQSREMKKVGKMLI